MSGGQEAGNHPPRQEVTGVSLTCRYFGITRQAFCIWLRRYE